MSGGVWVSGCSRLYVKGAWGWVFKDRQDSGNQERRRDWTLYTQPGQERRELLLLLGGVSFHQKMNHLLRKQSGSLKQAARFSTSETLSAEGGWETQGGGLAGKHRFRTGTRTPRLEPRAPPLTNCAILGCPRTLGSLSFHLYNGDRAQILVFSLIRPLGWTCLFHNQNVFKSEHKNLKPCWR